MSEMSIEALIRARDILDANEVSEPRDLALTRRQALRNGADPSLIDATASGTVIRLPDGSSWMLVD